MTEESVSLTVVITIKRGLAAARRPERSRGPGCKKLKGYKNQWRIRVGDWRVLCIIDDAAKLISVMRIATPEPSL